jgi:hypothetical protein
VNVLSPSSNSTENQPQPRSSTSTSSSTRRKRRNLVEEPITYALDRLEHISANINRQSEYDEFHYFAQNVAAQLRALPLYAALDVQNEIQTILIAARRRYQYPNLSPFTQTMTTNTQANTTNTQIISCTDTPPITDIPTNNTLTSSSEQDSTSNEQDLLAKAWIML